jgi:hypothetical protein
MAQRPQPKKAGETKLERYWRLRAEYGAAQAVFNQIATLTSQARFRVQTAQHMLEAARLELKVRQCDDWSRDVIIISVALVAAAIAAFVCPPLTAVIVRRMGYNLAGRMGTKVSLQVTIGAFAVSSASQYAVSYLATGRGGAMLGVAYQKLASKSLQDLVGQLPESVALLSCVKGENMYDTLISITRRADEEAGKITKSPEERRILARTILHKFWDSVHSDCIGAAIQIVPAMERLKAEVAALESDLGRFGPIAPLRSTD